MDSMAPETTMDEKHEITELKTLAEAPTTSVPDFHDDLRSDMETDDANLATFFSRPLLIATFDWGTGTTFGQTFNPWELFFSNKRVVNRLNNYRVMSARLHVKFMINGNAFYYGRLMASYFPLAAWDEVTFRRLLLEIDTVTASQRPRVFIDPCASQGGEMILPFMWPANLADNILPDWSFLGEIDIRQLSALKHANGASGSVTLSVLAWADEVQLSVPTESNNGFITPQMASEYTMGPVSKVASAVARIANQAQAITYIAPYARATEIGAKAVGAFASLFGYSKPTMLETGMMKIIPKNSIAVTNNTDDCFKLSVDGKQELTVDPRSIGLADTTDEMTIAYIAGKESYLTQFTWPLNTIEESLLFNIAVDPYLHRSLSGEFHLTPLCFAALPFREWRGSLRFRFQVVCSKFHRGRLKVVYDPVTAPIAGAAEYNTAYTTVVDISEDTDFTVTVGWGQGQTFRKVGNLLDPEALMFGTTPLFHDTTFDEYGNGVLSVYIVNELTVPNDTVNNDITVNVFVSACDDIEFAAPTGEVVSNLQLTGPPSSPEARALELFDARDGSKSALVNAENRRKARSRLPEPHMDTANRDLPEKTPDASQMSNYLPLSSHVNLVHYGEAIRSFRSLLKRYNLHEIIPDRHTEALRSESDFTAILGWGVQRNMMPFDPGFTNYTGTYANMPLRKVAGSNYAYCKMTMLRYISSAYLAWRGGIRWTIAQNACGCQGPFLATRYTSCRPENTGIVVTPLTIGDPAPSLNEYNDVTLQEGGYIGSKDVNPIHSIEVPWYSNYRWYPAKMRTIWDNSQSSFLAMPCFKAKVDREILATTQGTSKIRSTFTACAAAEDFSCYMFLSAPVVSYVFSAPSPDP
nr:MAG: hypothetical protein 2 [Salisharnavirus sp.]